MCRFSELAERSRQFQPTIGDNPANCVPPMSRLLRATAGLVLLAAAATPLVATAAEPAPDNQIAQQPQPGTGQPATPADNPSDSTPAQAKEPCEKSHAVNLAVTKALKKPPTNNPLDSFTYIAGIRCREKGFLKGDTMLRDNTFTDDLSKKGLDFTFTYYPDMTWSSFGAPAYSSMYITSLDLYTGKTGFLWPNGQIHATGSGWTGGAYGSSTANHAFKAEATAPLENWRIFELWYGQKLSKEFEVRIGKIYPWVKFASHQTSGIFQNMSFDYPGTYGTTTAFGNFLPYASAPLGIQLSYNPNSHHQVLFHVMDGKDDASGGYKISLADTTLNAEDGVEILAEYAYLDHSPNPKKLPGYYKIGFQGNTGTFTNFKTGQTSSGNYGGYLTLEKMLYAEPNVAIPRSQGLLGFLKFSGTAGNNSVVNLVTSGGLTYAGLIPGRDADMAGIGIAYAQFNPNASSFYAGQFGGQPSGSETTLEAVYTASLTPWLMLIASYQYIFNPSLLGASNPAYPNGHVVLLNTRINF